MRLEPKPSEVFIMTKYPHLGRYENILFTWFLKNIGWDDILRIDSVSYTHLTLPTTERV